MVVTYVITEACVDTKDRSCVDVCPADCISGDVGDRMLFIDPEVCIDCGACISSCPVDAIFAEEDLPDEWELYLELNRLHFENALAVRERLDVLVSAR